jgi:hypothetical protein
MVLRLFSRPLTIAHVPWQNGVLFIGASLVVGKH